MKARRPALGFQGDHNSHQLGGQRWWSGGDLLVVGLMHDAAKPLKRLLDHWRLCVPAAHRGQSARWSHEPRAANSSV